MFVTVEFRFLMVSMAGLQFMTCIFNGHIQLLFTISSESRLSVKVNKRAHGPWIAHLNPCQEERMFTTKCKSHSLTLKSILLV